MKKTTYTFNNTINEKKNDSGFLDALIEAGFLKENPWFNNKENADKEIKFIDEINNLIDALITPTKPKKKTTIEIEITKKKIEQNRLETLRLRRKIKRDRLKMKEMETEVKRLAQQERKILEKQ